MVHASPRRPPRNWTASDLPGLPALHVVEVLSRHPTMRAAAAELGVTHVAVSTTLSRLEARLGVQLFERGSGALRPTAACYGIVEAFEICRATLTRATRALAFDGPASLTLSLPRTAANAWLGADLEGFRAAAPGLALRTHDDDAAAPDFAQVDAAVVAGGLCLPRHCDGEPLFEERLTAVCTQHYAYGQRATTPAAIARSCLLIQNRDDWRRWFEEAGLVADIELKGIELWDPSLALHLASAGQAIALACTTITRPAIEAGALVAPVPVSIATGRRFWLVWPRGRRPSDDFSRVHDCLLARLGRAPGQPKMYMPRPIPESA